jgi:hypothetical protein
MPDLNTDHELRAELIESGAIRPARPGVERLPGSPHRPSSGTPILRLDDEGRRLASRPLTMAEERALRFVVEGGGRSRG